jgi:hypothetical protein
MSDYRILAIDETGKASMHHRSSTFILSGLITSEDFLPNLHEGFGKLKDKFFHNPDIVFHCRDMLRKKGPFSILRDTVVNENFWKEYIILLDHADIAIATIVVDKAKAKNLGWNDIAILRKAYSKLLEEFTKKQLTGSKKGKIVAESDPYEDKYLLEAHNKLQGHGVPSEGITGADYRNKMTSVSLVNKLNLDINVQIADNLAIMGHVFYELKINKIKNLDATEEKFKALIERKIANIANPAIFEVLV